MLDSSLSGANDYSQFKNASVLITGGTGSFGNRFVEILLRKTEVKKIVIFSRDEMKQYFMQQRLGDDPRLRFFIGDVRDYRRLKVAMVGIDYVIHAAALKIVPLAEYNPFEPIKTNILGAMNVIEVANEIGVKHVIALSTDKACRPENLYGGTKLVADKLFLAASAYSGTTGPKYSIVRYGNVMCARGSFLPQLIRQRNLGAPITITDCSMTRFMMTLDQAVDLVVRALGDGLSQITYVRKSPSMTVDSMVNALYPGAERIEIGARPGEKWHEEMIVSSGLEKVYDCDDYFVISTSELEGFEQRLMPAHFRYASDVNDQWLDESALQTWIDGWSIRNGLGEHG